MLKDSSPEHWKFLVFYYNPDEPRLFVANRAGAPFALNYARPMAWVITLLPFAIMLLGGIVVSLARQSH